MGFSRPVEFVALEKNCLTSIGALVVSIWQCIFCMYDVQNSKKLSEFFCDLIS